MKIGKPIEPMLVAESNGEDSKFAEIMKKHKGKTLAEIKYDGYRVQVHKSGKIYLFTKSLNELDMNVFPDLEKQLKNHPNGVYDGELVGFGERLAGFNAVKMRVRGNLDSVLVNQYPLQLRFFDVMQLEDKEVMDLPLYERRKLLTNYVENISQQFTLEDSEQLKGKYTEITDQGLEGLVCKNPSSTYQPGARNQDWVKLKKFLTLDLAILGIYLGEGKASKLPFAAILAGTKNENRYETIAKIGISNRVMIERLYGLIKDGFTANVPGNVILSQELRRKTYLGKVPYQYVTPEKSAVIEVKCLDLTKSRNWHSCGLENDKAYSLRIASIERIREDKRIIDCTSTKQIGELYSG